jgi:hypothetical protein
MYTAYQKYVYMPHKDVGLYHNLLLKLNCIQVHVAKYADAPLTQQTNDMIVFCRDIRQTRWYLAGQAWSQNV